MRNNIFLRHTYNKHVEKDEIDKAVIAAAIDLPVKELVAVAAATAVVDWRRRRGGGGYIDAAWEHSGGAGRPRPLPPPRGLGGGHLTYSYFGLAAAPGHFDFIPIWLVPVSGLTHILHLMALFCCILISSLNIQSECRLHSTGRIEYVLWLS